MRMPILEFTNAEDYIDHLKSRMTEMQQPKTRLDIGYEQGEPGEHGIRGVTFFAVATARLDDHIACWATPVYRSTNVDLEYFDKDQPEEKQAKTKVWEGHRKIKERMEGDGLTVEPGKWRIDEPEYLS